MEPNTSLSRSPKPNIQLPLSSYFLPFSTMITALLYNWKEIWSLKPALSFMFQPPISCKFRSANGIMDLNRAISDHRHGSVPCPLDHRHGSCPGTCCVSRSPSVHFQSPCFPPTYNEKYSIYSNLPHFESSIMLLVSYTCFFAHAFDLQRLQIGSKRSSIS